MCNLESDQAARQEGRYPSAVPAAPRPIPGPGRVWRLAAPNPGRPLRPLAKRGERNPHAEAPVALSMPSGTVEQRSFFSFSFLSSFFSLSSFSFFLGLQQEACPPPSVQTPAVPQPEQLTMAEVSGAALSQAGW